MKTPNQTSVSGFILRMSKLIPLAITLTPCLAVMLAAFATTAQNYSMDWFKIAGGGGTSTGGVYAVSGTIGQHDAGGPMTNGQYSVTGGFWALPGAVQSPGAPTLYITNAAPGFATIWWVPNTPSFTLQYTDSLSPTNWANAPLARTIPSQSLPRYRGSFTACSNLDPTPPHSIPNTI